VKVTIKLTDSISVDVSECGSIECARSHLPSAFNGNKFDFGDPQACPVIDVAAEDDDEWIPPSWDWDKLGV
jgi:hypothetical protein